MNKINKLLISIIIFLIFLVLYQSYFIFKISTEKERLTSSLNSKKGFHDDVLSFDLRHELNTPFNSKSNESELRIYNFLHKKIGERLLDGLDDLDGSFGESAFNPQIEETENEYKAYIDIPNVENKNISIEAFDGSLIISGTYSEKESTKNTFSNRSGSFKKVIPIPNDIKAEEITSNYENGILVINIPKNKDNLIKKELKRNLI